MQELNSTKNTSSNSTTPSSPAPAPAPIPVQPKARYVFVQNPMNYQMKFGNLLYNFICLLAAFRYDWYQTDSFVVINMMVKNTKKEDVHVDITEDTVRIIVYTVHIQFPLIKKDEE